MPALDYPFVNDRPCIPIIVTNPATGTSIAVFALIDTGADTCVFPESVITPLGCNLRHGNPSQTIGIEGYSITTYLHPLVINLVDPKDRNRVVKSLRQSDVECTANNHVPPLLGTLNFLNQFNLSVLYKLNITRLSY